MRSFSGLAHEICGEGGLGWSRRLQLVRHAGLQNSGGFPERVSKYLAKKYGHSPEAGVAAGRRGSRRCLRMLVARLNAQQQAGSRYYVGNELTAVDVYSATFTAMFGPLLPEQCKMEASTRAAFASLDKATEAALDPILFAASRHDVRAEPGVAARALTIFRRVKARYSAAAAPRFSTNRFAAPLRAL